MCVCTVCQRPSILYTQAHTHHRGDSDSDLSECNDPELPHKGRQTHTAQLPWKHPEEECSAVFTELRLITLGKVTPQIPLL